jgi:hypothetical protein
MAPLDTGRYIITNCLHKRVVILPNATQYSGIVGGTQAQNPGEMVRRDVSKRRSLDSPYYTVECWSAEQRCL